MKLLKGRTPFRRGAVKAGRAGDDGLPLSDRLVLAVLFVFLAVEVFQGALRYFFTLIGAPFLIYFPKLLVTAAFIGLAFKTARTMRISRPVFGVLTLFMVFVAVGVHYTGNLMQALFGLFALLPLLFAVLAELAVVRMGQRLVPYVALLWLCAAIGLVYDYFADLPWWDLAYQLGIWELEGSRGLATFGIKRLAGFSRAFYDVAEQLLFLALTWVILGKRVSLTILVWIATGALIVLTTSKKTVGVYLFLTLLLPLMGVRLVPGGFKRAVTGIIPLLVALIGIALPVSTLFVSYRLSIHSYVSRFLFASFEDRLTWCWPDAFSLVFDHGSMLLGRGIGGIGVAQHYFEPQLYSPADNLYLYLYATFGVMSLVLIAIYVASVCRLNVRQDSWARLMWFLGIAALMSGWAANGLEGPFTSTILGLTFAYADRRRRAVVGARAQPGGAMHGVWHGGRYVGSRGDSIS
ncbi:hypothetical protein [Desulfoglaeba alkanexedens]|uniref:O-antigen ligase family protein n=1 Tax=Desulfoglaeba alkanexedens ALDC TaxID=980445 RepID=A0A4P8L276_9BACT|nr:hypothetical protein [Desulfoglaeba alkanexedens]QCQ20832.1 hypothetical protein FDQ92_00620 [Desulfoglaeba alkanexedens ALDC]